MPAQPLSHAPGSSSEGQPGDGGGNQLPPGVPSPPPRNPSSDGDPPSVPDPAPIPTDHCAAGYLELRREAVRSYFPDALAADDFLARVEVALYGHGFAPENTIGGCRPPGRPCICPRCARPAAARTAAARERSPIAFLYAHASASPAASH